MYIKDHKPEDPVELKRIESMGGSIATKSGVNRVVWNRPILNPNKHRSNQSNNPPSTNQVPYDLDHYKSRPAQIQTERIPFLAVARSLGDLWSYDINRDEFIVSPVPDVFHFDLDPTVHKCLILGKEIKTRIIIPNLPRPLFLRKFFYGGYIDHYFDLINFYLRKIKKLD